MRPLLAGPPESQERGDALRALPLVILVSSAIAVLLNLHDPSDSLSLTLKVANATGFTIWGTVYLIRTLSKGRIGRLPAMLIAAPIATLLGFELGGALGAANPVARWLSDPWHEWRPILLSLLLTLTALAFFVLHFRATEYRAALETHRRQAAEARQSETLARLALLQAQIEPHFLFNTLANVQSMIQRDPQTASRMLDHLNRYLRGSLSRTRNPASTCGDEIELIEALLGIAAIRLGTRLRYRIRLPDELRSVQLPPLLLQPLVENALKHGIEPAVDGGGIDVECENTTGQLVLRVRDTGLGFTDGAPAGVGLSNIRARLQSVYGNEASLTLYRNDPRGTVAELALPLRPN